MVKLKFILGFIIFFGNIALAQDFNSLKQDLTAIYHQQQLLQIAEDIVPTKSWLEYLLKPLYNSDSVHLDPNADQLLSQKLKPFVVDICTSPTGQKICRRVLKKFGKLDSENIELQVQEVLNRLHLVLGSRSSRFDGWTYNHQMILFFDFKNTSSTTFYRQLIHEMFQLVDFKNDFITFGSEFGHGLKDILCSAKKVLEISELRWATSALRAFAVEDRVLSELRINSKYDRLQSLQCSARVTILRTYFAELNGYFNFEQWPMQSSLQNCSSKDSRKMTVQEQEAALLQYLPKNATEHYTLCEYLTEPDLDREFDKYIGFTSQGPRPKIGDP